MFSFSLLEYKESILSLSTTFISKRVITFIWVTLRTDHDQIPEVGCTKNEGNRFVVADIPAQGTVCHESAEIYAWGPEPVTRFFL